MIIVKITGGLGNQLFQYAFGLKWALLHQTSLKVDNSWYQSNNASTKRPFVLDCFNIDLSIANIKDYRQMNIPVLKGNSSLIKLWNKAALKYSPNSIRQKNWGDLYEDKTIPVYSYLQGYWFSERTCFEMKDQLQKNYTLNSELIIGHHIYNSIVTDYSVAVHIRRGDYVVSDAYLLDIQYFEEAILKMKAIHNKPLTFFVFSDEVDWAIDHLSHFEKQEKLDLVYLDKSIPSGKYDLYHFYLMKKCKHFIISNSTFSWWAAWLSASPNKTVICPKQFERSNTLHNYIVPKEWIAI